MAAVGCENEHELCDENEFLRKKGYSWSREETLVLISLYEEMKELFKNVNYKKKKTSLGNDCCEDEERKLKFSTSCPV